MLEVLTPASEVYGTLAEFKAFYQITDSTRDSYWDSMLQTASGVISDHCGRPLCSESVRETLRFAQKQKALVLDRWPITVTPILTYGESAQVVAAGLYEVDVRSGVVRGLASAGGLYTTFAPGLWKITYSGGFVTIPQRIKEATFRLVDDLENQGKLRSGVKSKRIEGVVSETYFDPDKMSSELGDNIKSLLRRYVER